MNRLPVAERREQLIEAALAVASRDGIDAATVRAVAAEAGVSLGVVHYCFQDKDELLRAMAARHHVGQPRSAAWASCRPRRDDSDDRRSRASSTRSGPASGTSRGPQLLSYELTTSSLRHAELNQVAIEQYRGQWAAAEQVLDLVERVRPGRLVGPAGPSPARVVAVIDGFSLAWLVDGDERGGPSPGCTASAGTSRRVAVPAALAHGDVRRDRSREHASPRTRGPGGAARTRASPSRRGSARRASSYAMLLPSLDGFKDRYGDRRRRRSRSSCSACASWRRWARSSPTASPGAGGSRVVLAAGLAAIVAVVPSSPRSPRTSLVLPSGSRCTGSALGHGRRGYQHAGRRRAARLRAALADRASTRRGPAGAHRRRRSSSRAPSRRPPDRARRRVPLLAGTLGRGRSRRWCCASGRRGARRARRDAPTTPSPLTGWRAPARRDAARGGRSSCSASRVVAYYVVDTAISTWSTDLPRATCSRGERGPGAARLRRVPRDDARLPARAATRWCGAGGASASCAAPRPRRCGRSAARRRGARARPSPSAASRVAGAGLGVIAPLCFSAAGDARTRARRRGRRAAQRASTTSERVLGGVLVGAIGSASSLRIGFAGPARPRWSLVAVLARAGRPACPRAGDRPTPPCGVTGADAVTREHLGERLDEATQGLPAPLAVVDLDALDANAADLVRRARAGRPSASPASRCASGTCSSGCWRGPGFAGVMALLRCARRSGWSSRASTTSCWATRRVDTGALRRARGGPRRRRGGHAHGRRRRPGRARRPRRRRPRHHAAAVPRRRRLAQGAARSARRAPRRPALARCTPPPTPARSPPRSPAGPGVDVGRRHVLRGPGGRAARLVARRSARSSGCRSGTWPSAAPPSSTPCSTPSGTSCPWSTPAAPAPWRPAPPTRSSPRSPPGPACSCPTLFDAYRSFTPRPAAFFGLDVVRIPGPGYATVFGGGYIASGPAHEVPPAAARLARRAGADRPRRAPARCRRRCGCPAAPTCASATGSGSGTRSRARSWSGSTVHLVRGTTSSPRSPPTAASTTPSADPPAPSATDVRDARCGRSHSRVRRLRGPGAALHRRRPPGARVVRTPGSSVRGVQGAGVRR